MKECVLPWIISVVLLGLHRSGYTETQAIARSFDCHVTVCDSLKTEEVGHKKSNL